MTPTPERAVQILCHRGWWRQPDQRNTAAALQHAFGVGLGIETDLRDRGADLVVSHDPPGTDPLPTVADLVALYLDHVSGPHRPGPLALNIKADGLAEPVTKALVEHGLTDRAFVFDMSVPDQLAWLRSEIPVFTRHSDVEPDPVLYDRSAGVWLDCFGERRWWTARTVANHLRAGKQVAVVSPELHGYDPRPAWDELSAAGLAAAQGLLICTDRPAEALEVFA